MRAPRVLLTSALLPILALASVAARADIYGFEDGGTLYLSDLPQDRRYRLLLRQPRPARSQPPGITVPLGHFRETVRQVALDHRLDPGLLQAVISVESGFDPSARSPKGAIGLMQLMPATARRFCVDDPYDPEQNIRGGASYLSALLERYDNDLALALAAYNAGEGAVDRYGGRIPPFEETRRYVPRVMAAYTRLGNGTPRVAAAPVTVRCER